MANANKTARKTGAATDRTARSVPATRAANARVEAPVAARVEAPVAARVEAPVAARVEAPVAARVEAPVEARVESRVEASVEAHVEAPVRRGRGRPPAHPDRRESILAAALEAFVERGFHGTAIPQIAERANIAGGTIYHYFESKEVLVNELYRSWKSAISKMVFARFPQGAPVREQFRTMWNVMVEFAMTNPTAFAFIELHNHASYLDDQSLAVDRTIKEFTASVIKRAQVEGLVKWLDANVLMELVFGAFVGMLRAYWEKRIVLDDAVIAAAEQACWDAIAVHSST